MLINRHGGRARCAWFCLPPLAGNGTRGKAPKNWRKKESNLDRKFDLNPKGHAGFCLKLSVYLLMAILGQHGLRQCGNGDPIFTSGLVRLVRFTATGPMDLRFGNVFVCTKAKWAPSSDQKSNRGLFTENLS